MITGAQLSVPAAAGSVIQGDLCINQPEPKHGQFGKGGKMEEREILSLMQLLPLYDTHILCRYTHTQKHTKAHVHITGQQT